MVRIDFEKYARGQRIRWWAMRFAVYGLLVTWAFVCVFPLFWTVSTSFKTAADVMRGNLIPWYNFTPSWLGWRSLGLSPDTIFEISTVREEFMRRLWNSVIISVTASALAVVLGSLAAYGLSRFSYKFGHMRNSDISFFFLSQLIMPPVVLALPFLVLYKELALLDSYVGMIAVYTLMVLPIVVWIMRDQFATVPVELEEAALVDGLSVWGAFARIIVPLVLPGMVAAFLLALILCWNEYFFAALLTSTNTNTLPVMIASQTGSQGINWWSMAALSTAGILPLVAVGVMLERHIIAGMTAGAVK
ncbi:multiple sugar transport system permease protein [Rhizobium leguminosarum]|uniref:Multiple sugar transport system permease protein n=1 Tax=Rhizobium leguminosarum TaxID=384 RepID=A0AAE2SZL5_RHILE|nr:MULTISPECIES: carbohydrate ABC transporter permease [Rhizobium]MBB4292649.1 multiple sugar transport system permease protein [Rhizobium leguminosarum]MBB4298887.1 multiple sugar transport system permease protein [Rhizobium leguminosarum]MBB4310140.1 multiple sugar transport system permease protein [Rhizobium leguminosarum]MBB4434402.1 multiple sugar transport system permease protein [Rhizobium esperanzae]MBB4531298.1 multiple sugar transport system permease protein [Rhizobium leguminosarum]